MPGIDEKDLDIKVENNTLTVTGERKFEKEEKEENFHRVERRYGSFTRSFTLPNTVSTDDIKAEYDHGVLKIRLAKRAEAKPKQIKVNVGGQKPLEGKKAERLRRRARARLPDAGFAPREFSEGDELGSSREAVGLPPFCLPRELAGGESSTAVVSSRLPVVSYSRPTHSRASSSSSTNWPLTTGVIRD